MTTSIGTLVKRRREALKISQTDLAWVARVSRGTVGNIERGAVSADSRTLVAVIEGLGLDYVATVGDSKEVERVPLSVARKILQVLLERRDGSARLLAMRNVARSHADEYIELVSHLEDDDIGDSENKSYLDAVAEFVVPLLESHSKIDQMILEWFHDLGWSEDDYPDWQGLKSDLVLNEYALSEGDGTFAKSFPAGEPQDEMREDQVSLSPSALETVISQFKGEMEELREDFHKATGDIFSKAAAFDRLPLRLKDILMKGSLADYDVSDIPGGFSATLFIRAEETEVPVEDSLLAIKQWEQVKYWLSAVYGLTARGGAEALFDPIAVFDSIEVMMVAHATNPDTLDYIKKHYPGRLEELERRYPHEFSNLRKEGPDGETE